MLCFIWVHQTRANMTLSFLANSDRIFSFETTNISVDLTSLTLWALVSLHSRLVWLWRHTRWLNAIDIYGLLDLLVEYYDLGGVFICQGVIIIVVSRSVNIAVAILVTHWLVDVMAFLFIIVDIVGQVVLTHFLSFYVLLIACGDGGRFVLLREELLIVSIRLLQLLLCRDAVDDLVISFDFHIFRVDHHIIDWLKLRRHLISRQPKVMLWALLRLLAWNLVVIHSLDVVRIRAYWYRWRCL